MIVLFRETAELTSRKTYADLSDSLEKIKSTAKELLIPRTISAA